MNIKKKQIISFQGIEGSNSHLALQKLFPNAYNLSCETFEEVFDSVEQKKADVALIPIENSIAGSIIPNYALLDHHNLNIEGERYLAISQNLMVMPGQKLEDIHEVWSHPMALLQCKEFFKDKEHIRLVEDDDTAGAAKRIADGNLKGIGAIAGTTAASIYGLDVIAHDIQTIKDNSTRFFILNTNGRTEADVPDKASVKFLPYV